MQAQTGKLTLHAVYPIVPCCAIPTRCAFDTPKGASFKSWQAAMSDAHTTPLRSLINGVCRNRTGPLLKGSRFVQRGQPP